ncbi:MAG: hypothetical protein Q7R33_00320, partial [Nitrosarchaeum sp.]|nr:hypothetical protein [Nitrosarchaeum sp.]
MSGKATSSGQLLSTGDVRVYIYDANSGGNTVYDSLSDFNGTISNGSFDILLGSGSVNLDLNYGQYYYLDFSINGEDLDFNGNDRKQFESVQGAVRSSSILDGTIVNADINSDANIAWTKINKTGSSLSDLATKNFSSLTLDSNSVFDSRYWTQSDLNSYLPITYVRQSDGNTWYTRKTTDDTISGSWDFTGSTKFSGGFGANGATIQNGILYVQSIVVVNDFNAATVTGVDINGNYIPSLNNMWNFGSDTMRWAGIYSEDANFNTISLPTSALAWASVNKTGSSLADLTTKNFSSLTLDSNSVFDSRYWTQSDLNSYLPITYVRQSDGNTWYTRKASNETVTGTWTFSNVVTPTSSDGAALGTTALMWSDLFLASGGVLNWNNGDVTVTHSTDTLAFAGATSGYTFDNNVVATTLITTPLVVGGTGTTSTLKLRPTSGVGAVGADIIFQAGTNGGTETMRISTITPSSITSYSNSGGTGDRRTTIISVTDSGCAGIWTGCDDPNRLVDGTGHNQQTNDFIAGGVSVADKWILFDFLSGNSKLITEAKWIQSGTSSHGTWRWQGSDDNSNWTNIGDTYTLGGSTDQLQTTLSGNTTGYRYYRMLGVSGTFSNSPWIEEIEFKIGVAGTFYYYAGINNSTPLATLDIKSWGTSDENAFRLTDSSGTNLFKILDNGTTSVKGSLSPTVSDANGLGTATLNWSDLFLASGGVANWNNGDVTLTHSSNLLTLEGGDLNISTKTKLRTVGNIS